MTKQEIQAEALDRARQGATLTNYPAIYSGFMAKGIAEADILPRQNVFTFNAWKALGRSVKKGEHGVRVITFKQANKKNDDGTEESYSYPSTTVVFHISQTETEAERQSRKQAQAEPVGKFRDMVVA